MTRMLIAQGVYTSRVGGSLEFHYMLYSVFPICEESEVLIPALYRTESLVPCNNALAVCVHKEENRKETTLFSNKSHNVTHHNTF